MNNITKLLLSSFGAFAIPVNFSLPSLAQSPSNIIKENGSTYENDRIRFTLQKCQRKQDNLICQGTLTSKKNDRGIELNLSTIKVIDFEGNEYYPNSLRLANRSSENNVLKTELVGNINVKTIIVFPKFPSNVDRIALLNIPIDVEQETTIAKWRNVDIAATNSSPEKTKPKSSATATTTTVNANNDSTLICPETTKIMYRAASKDDLLFICGAKTPTYFVSQAKDGSQGITLRLRYYDKKRFSADNGAVNYTIVGNRFTVTKGGKTISQAKISILQPLATSTATNSDPQPQQSAPTTSKPNKKPAKVRISETTTKNQPVKVRAQTTTKKKTATSATSKVKPAKE
jgi:hypothetical protein